MHELSVTQSVLQLALQYAEAAEAQTVTDLYLVIGDLSSIIDDSVQFYWDIISRGTIAEKAKLHFRRVPVEITCFTCQHHYSPKQDDFSCPVCGGTSIRVTAGEEFLLEAIDIESVKHDDTAHLRRGEHPQRQ